MKKEEILAEIRRLAKKNGNTPLGTERFRAETGIKSSDWQGKFWARWGDALVEAGFEPNQLQGPRSDEDLLAALASLTKELGRFPVANEIKLKARTEPGFPWHNTFAKFGNKQALANRLSEFCKTRGQEDVVSICESIISKHNQASSTEEENIDFVTSTIGYVYLLKHGSRREYKIGRTNNPLRREGEMGIQLPEKLEPVHYIKTDDPSGIESYWHTRFASKRKEGEWFSLSADDVRAFKRWKHIY